jgi:hypothetical protein
LPVEDDTPLKVGDIRGGGKEEGAYLRPGLYAVADKEKERLIFGGAK